MAEGFIALPFMGGVVAPLLSACAYVYSRRRWKLKQSSSFDSRAYLLYRIMSGVLLGQFLGHTYLVVDQRYVYLFVALGYVVLMDWSDNVGRVWNPNAQYTGPVTDWSDDDTSDMGLDRSTMQEQPVAVATDISSVEFAAGTMAIMDKVKLSRKRIWLLGVLVCVLTVLVLMDGFLMVAVQRSVPLATLIVCYYATCCAMTLAVCGALHHAKLFARPRAWALVTALWCAALVASAVPGLAFSDRSAAIAATLTHRAFLCFYGLASGCVLWLQRYYYAMKRDRLDKQRTAWGMLAFAVAVFQGVVSGYWL